MVFAVSLSLINLILYCAQQLGVTLGVGAETILLVAYLHAARDGVVDDEEKGFSRAVRHVMDAALFLIVVSGLGVIATQYLAGQQLGFFSTIFLFKWSLIGIVLFMSLANRGMSLAAGLFQGIAAATWFALFVVHILAPDASWLQLSTFYGIWLVGFTLCWTLLVFGLRGKSSVVSTQSVQKQKVTVAFVPKSVAQPAVVIVQDKVAHTATPVHAVPAVSIPPVLKQAQPIVTITPDPTPIKQTPHPVIPVVVAAPVPTPPPAPVLPPTPVPPPPAPPAPPKPVVASAPMVPPVPAAMKPEIFTGLHVMPRTAEEVAKRKIS